MTFTQIAGRFAVCRLPADAALPEWVAGGVFQSVTRTEEELSIVTPDIGIPPEVEAERGFVGFRITGQLDFQQTGILSEVTHLLAEAGIPVFVVSTFNTDYLFLRHTDLDGASDTLRAAGHSFLNAPR